MKTIVIGEGSGATIEKIMSVYPRHKMVVDRYIQRGEVIAIGPFADKGGNMAIFKTRAVAEQFVTEDPFILEGLIKSFVIRDWDANLLQDKNYTATIEVAKSPQDVFNGIKDVPKWWSKDFEGSSTEIDDEFVICHPDRHYSKQKLVEVISNKKMVWLVTDSKLNWIEKNKYEWTNTRMVFEIMAKGDKTVLHFTHEGLVPEKECYAMCEQGWNLVIKDWLFRFITEGKMIQT